jgi:hypothetical protein
VQLAAPAADHEPAAHAVQLAAPAAAHVPASQAAHTEFDVAEQLATRREPAEHVIAAAQAAQGAKPVADHVLPATQAGTAVHASADAFHAKPAVALHAQLVWPVSALPAL